jgi:O-antigen/teichoic acid export membrane protein
MTSAATGINARSFIGRVALSSIFNSATSLLGTVLFLPFVIHRIGIDNYGLWALIWVFVGFASALDFGISRATVYLIARKQYAPTAIISAAVVLVLFGAGIFSAAITILVAVGVPVFGPVVAHHEHLILWLAIGGCVIVIACVLTNIARGALEALFRGPAINIGYGLLTLLQYSAAALVTIWSKDPRALIASSVLVYLVIMALHIAYLFHVLPVNAVRPNRPIVMSIMSYGLTSWIADLPGLLIGPTALFLFALLATKGYEYGTFEISLKIAALAQSTLGMLASPLVVLAASLGTHHRARLHNIIARYLYAMTGLAAIGVILYWYCGRQMLGLFFKDNAGPIFRASIIMLLGTMFVAAVEPIARALTGLGKLKGLAVVRYAMLGVALLTLMLLSDRMPLPRFSLAVSIGYVACSVGVIILYLRNSALGDSVLEQLAGSI